ncbi:MAG: DUF6448 family protein [Salinivirgaceae bacterium]
MKTKEKTATPKKFKNSRAVKTMLPKAIPLLLLLLATFPVSAHCDSYDGPTLRDAAKALETNNVNLVLKWIAPEQEKEIISLFNKTYALKSGDREIYSIVEKHFFETLVRLHRETEGAPYTGLKPAGTTKKIIQLSDQAIDNKDIDGLIEKVNHHLEEVLREKYEKVAALNPVKNNSPEKGREFVEAYVDYTHTIEAIHDIAVGGSGHSVHKH